MTEEGLGGPAGPLPPGRELMIELPGITLDFLREIVTNFTIIATLVLLYSFIPESLTSRWKLAYPVFTGVIFSLAAALSIPALWQDTNGAAIGVNIVLVPVAGFTAGPVSAAIVAGVLLLGSYSSSGMLSLPDILTIMLGVLLGSLFFQFRTRPRFARTPFIQLALLGAGVVAIEAGVMLFLTPPAAPGSPAASPGGVSLLQVFPFFLVSWAGTVLIGFIIGYIDRHRQAERELVDYKDHLERLVKERTAELEWTSSLHESTIESTADAIVVADRSGSIRSCNQKASGMLGISEQQLGEEEGGADFSQATAACLADPSALSPLIASLPESAEQVVTTDLLFRNGRIYELYVHPQYVGDYLAGRVWSFHDVTEQRIAEQAIAAANNKLMLLSALTRHDIFNQLTAILAYLELTRMEDHSTAATGYLDAMRKSLDVIHGQLEFTRDYQDLGLKKPVWQEIGAAFRQAAEAWQDRGISFACSTGTAEVLADPMIGRVFYNLIDNSLRHGERVSEIRLSVQQKGQDLLLLYEDNGVGVPADEKERIFLRGFGKHTGLGMFLIREILSITGITIRETGTPGQGIRFEMLVPSGRFRKGP